MKTERQIRESIEAMKERIKAQPFSNKDEFWKRNLRYEKAVITTLEWILEEE